MDSLFGSAFGPNVSEPERLSWSRLEKLVPQSVTAKGPAEVVQWLKEETDKLRKQSFSLKYGEANHRETVLFDIERAERVAKLVLALQDGQLTQELEETHRDRARIEVLKRAKETTEQKISSLAVSKSLCKVSLAVPKLSAHLCNLFNSEVEVYLENREARLNNLCARKSSKKDSQEESFIQAMMDTISSDFEKIKCVDDLDKQLPTMVQDKAAVQYLGCCMMLVELDSVFLTRGTDSSTMPELQDVLVRFLRLAEIHKEIGLAAFYVWVLENKIDQNWTRAAVWELANIDLPEVFTIVSPNANLTIDAFFVVKLLLRLGEFPLMEEYTMLQNHIAVPDQEKDIDRYVQGLLRNFKWKLSGNETLWQKQWNYLMFLQRQWPRMGEDDPALRIILKHLWNQSESNGLPSISQLSELVLRTPMSLEESSQTRQFLQEKSKESDAARELFMAYCILHNDPATALEMEAREESSRGLQYVASAQAKFYIDPHLIQHGHSEEEESLCEDNHHATAVELLANVPTSMPQQQQPAERRNSSNAKKVSSIIPQSMRVQAPKMQTTQQHSYHNNTLTQQDMIDTSQEESVSFFKRKPAPAQPPSPSFTEGRKPPRGNTTAAPEYQPLVTRKRKELPKPKMKLSSSGVLNAEQDRKRGAETSPSQTFSDDPPQSKRAVSQSRMSQFSLTESSTKADKLPSPDSTLATPDQNVSTRKILKIQH